MTIQEKLQEDRPEINLVSNQELIAIQVIWNRDGYFDHSVGELYKDIYNKNISTRSLNSLDQTERRLLIEICKEDVQYYNLIENLISLQETKTLMVSKFGIGNDIEMRIESFVKTSKNEN